MAIDMDTSQVVLGVDETLTDIYSIDILASMVELDSRAFTDGPVVVVGAGQSGLAAARALNAREVPVVVLEAGDRPAGSWPRYYDSLRLFSPAAYSSMPGRPFPGDPDRYPTRDEVADYLEQFAASLPVEIHTNTRVATVRQEGRDPG